MDPFLPEFSCGVMYLLRIACYASVPRIVGLSVKSILVASISSTRQQNLSHLFSLDGIRTISTGASESFFPFSNLSHRFGSAVLGQERTIVLLLDDFSHRGGNCKRFLLCAVLSINSILLASYQR